ncbi:terminase small subunit [Pseudanabaena phage Pam3]|nr:terminase small subunit [Pseudanabaena phage Pam3]
MKPTFEHGPAGAQKLYEACCDYFTWCEENPLYEAKLVSFEGVSSLEEVPKCRAFTIGGLCLFIDIDVITWRSWRSERQDLAPVQRWAEEAIRTQKFNAAAAGLLNASIIARDLGLADKQEVSGPGGGPIATINGEMTAQEAAEAYARTRDGL